MTSSFRIGGASKEYVEVAVLRRERPNDTDYWDGNWLAARIGLEVGGFRGGYEASIRTTDLHAFGEQLQELNQKLTGEAEFTTLEEQFRLRLVGDGRGHVAVMGVAQDQAGIGNRLEFRLNCDQTQLAPLIASVASLRERYPVRGTPAA